MVKCKFCKKSEAKALIRTRPVCKECYKILKEDNVRRQNKGIKIDKKLDVLEIEDKRLTAKRMIYKLLE